MSTQNSLVIIKEKIAGVMLDDKRMKADDIAKKFLNAQPVIILPYLFLAIKHMIGEISIHKFCI